MAKYSGASLKATLGSEIVFADDARGGGKGVARRGKDQAALGVMPLVSPEKLPCAQPAITRPETEYLWLQIEAVNGAEEQVIHAHLQAG